MTLTDTVHDELAAIVAPVGEPKKRVEELEVGDQVGVPVQVVEALGIAATVTPLGSVSEKFTPDTLMLLGFDKVKVSVETPLTATVAWLKVFVMVTGAGVLQPVKRMLSKKISAPC